MSSLRPLVIVASLGTGAATARLSAKSGYSVALIAEGQGSVHGLVKKINDEGGNQAAGFPVESYIQSVFSAIKTHFPSHTYALRAAVWNAGPGLRKPFLEITEQNVQNCVDTNVVAAFAFAQQAILGLIGNELDNTGKKGTLIFTGTTASSLAKEFGREKIHVSHVIVDGSTYRPIPNVGGRLRGYLTGIRREGSLLEPGSELEPDSIAQSYFYLTNQDHSAVAWELDLRPVVEMW
ncbi:hypothetical protein BDN72DRAFT_965263 [Pluteus cervinus]|uniref:Uncharacterized protein n=1 Tax=Pluteus cervinus TaxID=181527 RepID=A0ACD3A797_9AGAR|nr:hypothetical protein BDN72DRAFT_965263 [Pluteus cervinus]